MFMLNLFRLKNLFYYCHIQTELNYSVIEFLILCFNVILFCLKWSYSPIVAHIKVNGIPNINNMIKANILTNVFSIYKL